MAYGTIGGTTKDWTDKDIKGAANAGLFFKASSASTPIVAQPKPIVTTTSAIPKPIVTTVPVTPKIVPVATKTGSASNDMFKDLTSYTAPKVNQPVTTYDFTKTPSQQNQPVAPQTVIPQPVIPQPVAPSFDYNELKKMFDQYLGNRTQEKYISPYDERIASSLSKLENQTPFVFDTNNPALLQAQEQAMQMARRSSANRGRLFDTYTQAKEQEAAQNLLPSYYNIAREDYNAQQNNNYNLLNTLRNADQTAYSRFNDTGNQTKASELEAFNNSLKLFETGLGMNDKSKYETQQKADKLKAEETYKLEQAKQDEIKKYGIDLSPEARANEATYLGMNTEDRNRLSVYQNDIQARINELRRTSPNSPDIKLLESMRTNKIINDPNLLNQYGADIAMKNPLIESIAKTKLKEVEASETKRYGTVLSNGMREYINISNSLSQADRQRLGRFYDNYAGEAKRLSKQDPNNPDILKLVALRAEKILSDPKLLAQYGSEYGMQGADIRANARAEIKADLDIVLKKLDIDKSRATTAKEFAEVEKIANSIMEIKANIDYKNKQVDNLELDRLAKQIEVSVLPAIKRAEYEDIIAGIKAKNASATSSYASANSSNASASASYERAKTENALRSGELDKQDIDKQRGLADLAKTNTDIYKSRTVEEERANVGNAYAFYNKYSQAPLLPNEKPRTWSNFIEVYNERYPNRAMSGTEIEALQKIVAGDKNANPAFVPVPKK